MTFLIEVHLAEIKKPDFTGYFTICNSKEKLIKVYEKDTTGVWVYIRSLDSSKFGWPRNISEAKEIKKSQLERLLKGLQYINFSSKNTDYNCY